MSSFNAPGPDGLSAGFYQHMWDILKDLVFCLAQEFFELGVLPPGLNDTLTTLIPKVQNPETILQLRPISLCNVGYKNLTRVMANRIKEIMQRVVAPN